MTTISSTSVNQESVFGAALAAAGAADGLRFASIYGKKRVKNPWTILSGIRRDARKPDWSAGRVPMPAAGKRYRYGIGQPTVPVAALGMLLRIPPCAGSEWARTAPFRLTVAGDGASWRENELTRKNASFVLANFSGSKASSPVPSVRNRNAPSGSKNATLRPSLRKRASHAAFREIGNPALNVQAASFVSSTPYLSETEKASSSTATKNVPFLKNFTVPAYVGSARRRS